MKENNFRVAVKGFIIHEGKLFIMKRAKDDIQMPNVWEIPGGRLEIGEDPVLGVMREIREEAGLYVKVIKPLTIRHFKRQDNQIITMIVFLCKPNGGFLKISNEHSDYQWMDLKNYKRDLTDFFHKEVKIFLRENRKK